MRKGGLANAGTAGAREKPKRDERRSKRQNGPDARTNPTPLPSFLPPSLPLSRAIRVPGIGAWVHVCLAARGDDSRRRARARLSNHAAGESSVRRASWCMRCFWRAGWVVVPRARFRLLHPLGSPPFPPFSSLLLLLLLLVPAPICAPEESACACRTRVSLRCARTAVDLRHRVDSSVGLGFPLLPPPFPRLRTFSSPFSQRRRGARHNGRSTALTGWRAPHAPVGGRCATGACMRARTPQG